MYKKYFPEHSYYFIAFLILSLLYIINGYASLGINDDWALRGMLTNQDVYGTLIMSYPLSYIMSKLYDIFPLIPWYSSLLTLVIGINFYLISLYIAKNNSYIQKVTLFILALLWMTFIWFNTTITIVTILTMVSAVGLIRKNLFLSFVFIFLASLLRTDMMIIFIPYYSVSFFILRDTLKIKKSEAVTFAILVTSIVASIFLQKQDHNYTNWLQFNKARSAIVDMHILEVKKDFFTKEEEFIYKIGWLQDDELLSTEKIIETTPSLASIIQKNIKNINIIHILKMYKFKHWLWLLLALSFIAILINRNNRKALFIPILVLGIILLLITRDVERVTVPIIMLWFYVISENLKSHKILNTIFIALFTYIFYYYISGQLGYRYFKENTILQKEASKLIQENGKTCEVSMNYPTRFSSEVNAVFKANYLFRENSWIQLNNKGVLPTGWLVRHEFFYKSHNISYQEKKRKYNDYYEYLIDDETAFFGGKALMKGKKFNTLLNAYDRRYLKDRPSCKHNTFIIAKSKHFAISQIRVDCNHKKEKAIQY